MVAFERPVGASADVKELEYVSSLHQTAEKVRTDGSIKGKGLIERRAFPCCIFPSPTRFLIFLTDLCCVM